MTVLIVIAAVISVLLLLLVIPIKIAVSLDRDAVKNDTSVTLKYGFIKMRLYPPKNKTKKKDSGDENEQVKENKEFSFEEKKAELEKYIQIFGIVKSDAGKILERLTKQAVYFDIIEINSKFGFENAMHTGIFTGIYNGFVYSILGFIHHNTKLKDMKVELQPVFENVCFELHIHCILGLKPVHIIIIALNILKLYKRIKKKGVNNYGRTPDSRTYGHGDE